MRVLPRLTSFVASLALAVGGLTTAAALPAAGAVLTFDDIQTSCDPAGPAAYVEDGVTAVGMGRPVSGWGRPGQLHFDDTGTGCPWGVQFTFGGALFDVTSVDVLPFGTRYCADPAMVPPDFSDRCIQQGWNGDEYDNVRWQGMRDGALVAQVAFFQGRAPHTYVFGDAFRHIDTLTATALQPYAPGGFNEPYCADAPCMHFSLDNLALALTAVPLPPAAWLMVTALGGLAAVRRRRR